jgi:hypothetical protein
MDLAISFIKDFINYKNEGYASSLVRNAICTNAMTDSKCNTNNKK